MKKIELLPEHIIDQIKAGEVIERPSTLIKELLENSIDAKSTKIKIQIINSGLDLISIEDNGHGMSFDDLPLAFSRHATSKIEDFEDIYKLHTYGFRGEALASIASVSKVTCISNKANEAQATIKFDGAMQRVHTCDIKKLTSCGTSIYIKELFFNTPVRMKFIQSKTTEKNQLRKIVNSFVLTHPEIEFDVTWDEDSKIRYHSVDENQIQRRVKDLFEKRTNPLELLETQASYDGFNTKIILSKNTQKGNAGKFYYLFINDRFIQDIQIHKIILNSAKDLWPSGESGNYCVFIDAPPDQIDVNVHPNKTVVKIFQAPKLYTLISSSIKEIIFTQNKRISSPSNARQTDFTDTSIPRDLNYKEQVFDQDFSLQNYFDILDNKDIAEYKSQRLLYSSDRFTLYKSENNLLLLNNESFLINSMNKLIKSSEIEASPLLVSEPFKIKSSNKDDKIFKLHDIGYEIDRLDEETLVLRAFPSVLNEFPYLDFFKYKINQIVDKSKLEFAFKPKEFQITSQIEKNGLSFYLENKSIKILTDATLKDIF